MNIQKRLNLAFFIVVLCIIRTSTNMVWPFWGGPTLYYVGQGAFEAGTLFVLITLADIDWLKYLLTFFFGNACYALLKEFWQPTELDFNEYYGFFVGLVFTSVLAWKNWNSSRKR